MRNRRISDEELLAQIPAARNRGRIARASGARAITARYSKATGRLTVALANSATFSFPTSLVPGLSGATPAQLAKINISPSGEGLLWPEIDADLSVAGMLEAILGGDLLMSQLGRVGGLARSDAKAKASRSNGAKGGRPRKTQ